MKKIRVNAYQVALVCKRGAYQKMLTTGSYWFWGNETVYIYDITKPFHPPVELNILLQDQELAEVLHVIEVKDNEIVLQYENGLLKQVLTAGRYTFWKSVVIILPGDAKEIMNQVLIAEKKAQANTIMRREETASTRSLLNTAKLMEENAMLWKLKEME